MASIAEAVSAFGAQVKAERSEPGIHGRRNEAEWANIAEMLCAVDDPSTSKIFALLIAVACERGGLATAQWVEMAGELVEVEAPNDVALDCLSMLFGWRARVSVEQAREATDDASCNAPPSIWAMTLAREAMAMVCQPEEVQA